MSSRKVAPNATVKGPDGELYMVRVTGEVQKVVAIMLGRAQGMGEDQLVSMLILRGMWEASRPYVSLDHHSLLDNVRPGKNRQVEDAYEAFLDKVNAGEAIIAALGLWPSDVACCDVCEGTALEAVMFGTDLRTMPCTACNAKGYHARVWRDT